MASTIPPQAAFDICKNLIKKMPMEEISPRILDDINKRMWMAAPWRWTVGTLTNIALVSNTQDYTLAPPADFLYLLHTYVSDGATAARHLEIMPSLPTTVVQAGVPDFISYQGSNTFRVSPNPGTLVAPTKYLVSFYKKAAPTIIASNANTAGTLVFDDEWFPVYEMGVLWLSYLYADDNRAGSCQVDSKGNIQFTGQRAIFEAELEQMRQREPLPEFLANVTAEPKERS
jgi:hypothetical protein